MSLVHAPTSAVHVHNEWDPLEEVIVGRATNARWPMLDLGLLATEHAGFPAEELPASGPFPPRVIEETSEDLEALVATLERAGVRVRRPDPCDHGRVVRSPDWETDGMANYCPRDVLLAVGDTLIEAPMMLRSRQHEISSYKPLLLEYFESGARWIAAPRPRLLDSVYRTQPPPGGIALTEAEPIFDAANVLRLGRDLLYLVSDSGNLAGARWLSRTLGADYRVHPVDDIYSSIHIDTTVVPIRPGLVLVNGTRVRRDNLPALFRRWDVIYFDRIVDPGYTGYPASSEWVGMNFLMIHPHLAIVDRLQEDLLRVLERHRVDVVPLSLRHARTLGGGFHCVTLDVRRRGTLESYCS